jgi:hypothetical protein
MNVKDTKRNIIRAGQKAVDELIRVAEEKIITNTEDDVSADRLKNAAATKKLAIIKQLKLNHLKALQKVDQNELYADII